MSESNEQWVNGGDCSKCRKQKYCGSKCNEYHRRYGQEIKADETMWFKYLWIVEFGVIYLGIWVYNFVNKTRRKEMLKSLQTGYAFGFGGLWVVIAFIVAGICSLLYFMGEIGG